MRTAFSPCSAIAAKSRFTVSGGGKLEPSRGRKVPYVTPRTYTLWSPAVIHRPCVLGLGSPAEINRVPRSLSSLAGASLRPSPLPGFAPGLADSTGYCYLESSRPSTGGELQGRTPHLAASRRHRAVAILSAHPRSRLFNLGTLPRKCKRERSWRPTLFRVFGLGDLDVSPSAAASLRPPLVQALRRRIAPRPPEAPRPSRRWPPNAPPRPGSPPKPCAWAPQAPSV